MEDVSRARAPRQERSRVTEARILDALDTLLRRFEWSDVTIERIAEQAELSVGAFYKRFASRTESLAALLERTQRTIERHQDLTWCAGDLRSRVEQLVDATARAWAEAAPVIRAVTSDPEVRIAAGARDAEARMRRIVDGLLECRGEITHADPGTAVRLGVYFTLSPLQQALCDPGRPADSGLLIREAKRFLVAYLTSGEPTVP